MTARRRLLPLALIPLLAACQGHLPPLETQEHAHAPLEPKRKNAADIVNHIQCELLGIVAPEVKRRAATWTDQRAAGTAEADADDAATAVRAEYATSFHDTVRTQEELTRLTDLSAPDKTTGASPLTHLIDDHFVATVQLNLDVTDAEGFTPSLSFITTLGAKSAFNRTTGLGGSVTSSQDRSVNLGYSIDLATLASNPPKNCSSTLKGADGVGGNLGLVDIIYDGMGALNAAADHNIYPATPVPPSSFSDVNLVEDVTLAGKPNSTRTGFLLGTLVITPASAGGTAPETVSFNGTFDLPAFNALPAEHYVMTLTGWSPLPDLGTIAQPFSGTGALTFFDSGSPPTVPPSLGYTANVAFTGARKIDDNKIVFMSGYVPPSSTSVTTDFTNFRPHPVQETEGVGPAILTLGAGSTKPSSSAGTAGGGSTFGTIVTFTLVYGLNGGPTWTLVHFKGPAGSPSLANIGRTNTDSLTVSFTPACRNPNGSGKIASFWDTISICSDLPTQNALAALANSAYITNQLLRGIVIRP